MDLFEGLNIEYENAYQHNPLKIACIEKAMSLMPRPSSSGAKVLDIGCGTGIPVSKMLSEGGFDVIGLDISPKMVELASQRIRGRFIVSDMRRHDHEEEVGSEKFAGIFVIFSQLVEVSYGEFHGAMWRFANTLVPGGLLVLGQMPSDKYVSRDRLMDDTYIEGYDVPFMGELCPTFMFSEEGQVNFLTSMGLEIVSNEVGVFQPKNPKCEPEEQQYVIARRADAKPLERAKPLP